MAQPQPTRLLTTRLRSGVAAGLTAFVFALAVREALHLRHTRGWLLPLDFVLHGWPLVAVNVFYGYLCWLAFWFIRGAYGREHVVMVGWFAAVLLSPLDALQPGWAVESTYISAFGLTVALLAAISLMLCPTIVGSPAT